jgi:hypothetical protein
MTLSLEISVPKLIHTTDITIEKYRNGNDDFVKYLWLCDCLDCGFCMVLHVVNILIEFCILHCRNNAGIALLVYIVLWFGNCQLLFTDLWRN